MLINSATLNAAVVNGAAANVVSLAAFVQTSSNTTAPLDLVKRIGSSTFDTVSSVGDLTNTIPLAGVVALSATGFGTTHQDIPLAGFSAATPNTAAWLGVTKSLLAGGLSDTVNSAPLGDQAFGGGSSFVGSIASVADANLDVIRAVAAKVYCVATATGDLHLDVPIGVLQGTAAISNVMSADLHLYIPIAGSAYSETDAVSGLHATKTMGAYLFTQSSAGGDVHIDKPLGALAGTAAITNTISARLHQIIPLAGFNQSVVGYNVRLLAIDAIDASVTKGSYADVEFVSIYAEAELFYPNHQERLAA
jgi:hypothetical protein